MVDDGTTGAHHPPVPSGAPREPLTGAPPPPAAASGPDGLPTAWATPLWRPGGLVPTRDVGAVPEPPPERSPGAGLAGPGPDFVLHPSRPPSGSPHAEWTPSRYAGVTRWSPPVPSPAPTRLVAPPTRSRRPGLAGAVVVALALLLAFVAVPYGVRLLWLPPEGRSTATPTPSPARAPVSLEPRLRPVPTPAPSSATPRPASPIGSALYPLSLEGTCVRPKGDTTWAAVQATIRTQAECLDRMWQPVVERAGGRWSSPVVAFYSDPIERTPCGPTPNKEQAPAHYCPGNRTIYISDAVTDPAVRHRLLGFEVVAHEYAHHVQELLGILRQAQASGKGDLVSRRIELQAHCVAYSAMVGMSGLAMTSRELESLRSSWKYAGDPAGHGSGAAQTYWGERGVESTTLGACDTFSADEDLVT